MQALTTAFVHVDIHVSTATSPHAYLCLIYVRHPLSAQIRSMASCKTDSSELSSTEILVLHIAKWGSAEGLRLPEHSCNLSAPRHKHGCTLIQVHVPTGHQVAW